MIGPGDEVTNKPERTGFEHLAPVWAEHAGLEPSDPRRTGLRAELILGYGGLARNIAQRYRRRHEPYDDIEQVARLGLVLAVDRYDPTRGADFLSFAVPTITGEVLRYFRDRTAPVRVPRPLRQLQGRIHDATAELAQVHGRPPRPSEIAAHLRVDGEQVVEALAAEAVGYTYSLDEPAIKDGLDGRHRGRFDAALGHAEPQYDLVEDRLALAPLLAELPDRERRILHLRFVDGLTQTEIGERIGVSQMHVSRLLSRTIQLLRRRLLTEGTPVSQSG